jgi:glycosyltransferase involved in cell wall biosynthesis
MTIPNLPDTKDNQQAEGFGPSPQVSVVLPIFEEEEMIKQLIPEIIQTFETEGRQFEIVAVDDGSRDNTPATLKELKQAYPDRLFVVSHLFNKGNGAALRTGTRVAQGDIIVYMDSDGQHSPRDIPELLAKIPPYDLVVGARSKSYRGNWYRNLANRFYNRFATWLSGMHVFDLTSGFRAFRRSVGVHFLHLYPTGFSTPTTMTLAFLKAGYNVVYVPVDVKVRVKGRSKIKLWDDGARFVIIILRMIMLFDPLRIFLPTGVGLMVIGVLAWIAGLLQANRLVLPNSAIFLFIAALLTSLLGLVSSQIANTRIQYHGDETIVVDGEPR